jgi:hypothetical protein
MSKGEEREGLCSLGGGTLVRDETQARVPAQQRRRHWNGGMLSGKAISLHACFG